MSTEIVETKKEEAAEVVDTNCVELGKEYEFEGKTYTSLNLNSLYDITGEDMIQVNRMMNRSGAVSFSPEMEMEFAFYISSRATGIPVEFFKQLNMRDSLKVKNTVIRFLFDTESVQ